MESVDAFLQRPSEEDAAARRQDQLQAQQNGSVANGRTAEVV
jgi:hypothetical protein